MEEGAEDGKNEFLDRRTYLKITGVTALSGLGTTAGAAASDRTDVLVLETSETVSYEFSVSGELERVETDGDLTDTIDGGAVSGELTDGMVGYRLSGDVEAIGFDGPASVEYGSAADLLPDEPADELVDTSPGEKPPTSELVIISPTEVDYTFTTTGGIEKLSTGGDNSGEDDSVVQNDDGTWTADGYTWDGYGDSYEIRGSVTSFSPMEGDYVLVLDGEEVTAYDLTGEERPADDTTQHSTAIGGGDGYENTVDPSEATVTVSNAAELEGALDAASAGDVVYVDGDANIETGSAEFTIPDGVTLASDRGIDGSPGGQIRTENHPRPMFTVGDDARVTGVRISGDHYTYVDHTDGETGMGLDVYGDGVEIDNCEIFGFGYAAVRARNDTHVHHSYIHHNPMDGVGYGVTCQGGDPTIEYNYMNYNRHSVASDGDGGYSVAYNHFGPDAIDHVIDAGRPGGTTMNIHHNTIEATTQVQDGSTPEGVAIRGTPDDVADIHSNWFHNPNAPKSSPDGWDGFAITQLHTNDWNNVEFSGNRYGSDDPSVDAGHPR